MARKSTVGTFLVVSAGLLWMTAHDWSLTAVAPLGWRLRVLIPDACITVPCTAGLALATWSDVPWLRRLGWGLVLVTVLLTVLVTALLVQ